jgi:hypothetical protein
MSILNILSPPENGGSPITDVEYRINGGPIISIGATIPQNVGLLAVEGDTIETRAVNEAGPGDWYGAVVPVYSEAQFYSYSYRTEQIDP